MLLTKYKGGLVMYVPDLVKVMLFEFDIDYFEFVVQGSGPIMQLDLKVLFKSFDA